MGKWGKKRKFTKEKGSAENAEKRAKSWDVIEKENEAFSHYYKVGDKTNSLWKVIFWLVETTRTDKIFIQNLNDVKLQGIVHPEEWDAFISVLKTGLPATFRVTGTRSYASAF